jgi:KaiC/GvpD/RAD55 family RecA-like ATPase
LDSALKLLKDSYGEPSTRVEKLAPEEMRGMRRAQNIPPYRISTEGHLHKREGVFIVGRDRELNRLKNIIRHDPSARVGIIGHYRTGKTWFLHNFLNRYNEPGRLMIYISMMDYSGEKRLLDKDVARIFYTRTLRSIQDQYPRHSLPESKRPPLSLVELVDWLRDASKATGLHFTFLLDEFSAVHDWVVKAVVDRHFIDRFTSFLETATGTAFVLVFQAAGVFGLTGRGYELQQLFEGPVRFHPRSDRLHP